jgi:proline iminopeptidase
MVDTKYWKLETGSNIGYVYMEARAPKKPYPIIYLHGGPGANTTENIMKMLIPFSEAGYDVYAYDQIGSGSSTRLANLEEYTVTRHKSDLEAIIKKIEAEKVILIGQSWGSVLATFFVVDNPNKVEKIVMTGPGPIFPINTDLINLKAPDSLNIKEPKYSNQDGKKEIYTFRDKLIKWYACTFGNKLASDEEVDDFFTHLRTSLNRSAYFDSSLAKESAGGGGYYAHVMTYNSLLNVENPREKMKKLKLPILILKGQYDNQKWGLTQEYIELLPEAEMRIIPNAGHFIDIEQPELYYQEIVAFLNQEAIR